MTEIERQTQLEADARQDGILRFCRNREFTVATDSKPIRDLVAEALKPFAEAILQEQVALKAPGSQKLPRYGTPLLSIDNEKLALITLCTLFNAITQSEFEDGVAPAVTNVAYDIGQYCRHERLCDCFRKREVDIAKELGARNRSRHAIRRAEELAQQLDDDEEWAKSYRSFHLGDKLIALAVRFAEFEGQPIFEFQTVRESDAQGTKTTQRIALKDAASDWIADHDTTLAFLMPVYLPMVVPPRPWRSLSGGGYLVSPLNLLKRQPTSWAQRLLKKADLAIVLSAVNAMQNTPYRINKDISRIMRGAWGAEHLVFGLPTHTVEPLPPRLPDDADFQEIQRRKQERAEVYNLNNQIKGLKKMMAFRLSLVERFLDERQFYFPYQLDHRGRAYPVPQLVNPQSDHIGRSLLEFAEGKRLGERGAHWLAIHIANCYWKGNKVSFEKRRKWVDEHEEEIIAFASDPLRPHRFWHEADKLWMFLAACLEWKRYKEEGADFLSHLPVSMDGTCNGYQHLSAMGRDPIGGSATNLLPGDHPEDMYQETADHVSILIMFDAEYGNGNDREAAEELLGKIDRGGVKHATITTPYGVTRGAIYKQLLEQDWVNSCKDPKKCARYLAKVLEECIPEVAVEAGKIMKWLREVAGRLAKANRGMVWTTPAGFCVVHETREPKTLRIATSDRTFVLYEQDETRKIDARKLADGIVAHFVHSLDAAHMMLTVDRVHREGIRYFAMVHDSFGVHACDVDILNRVLREEFGRIYSQPILPNFLREQMKAHPGVALPALSPPGNLDIRQVLSSPYFFA
jgi:DNA-directed RNA polymerase